MLLETLYNIVIEITRKSDENPLKNRIKTINKIIIKKVKLKNKYNLRLD